MPDYVIWIIVGIIGAVALVALIWFLIKFFKANPEQRKEMAINLLVGLVTIAEDLYEGPGRGEEKMAWVQEEFEKTAPWFVKMVLYFTKSASFGELVEKALDKAKGIKFDKDREIEE